MSENFNIEIVSPNKKILSAEISEVTIPCFEGLMTILKDHIPLITFLRPGFIVVKNKDKEETFFVEEGTVEFFENNLLILSTSTRDIKNFKDEEISKMIKDTEANIKENTLTDKDKYILSYKLSCLKEISRKNF